MKKVKGFKAILLAVGMIFVFALAACSVDLENADYTENYNSSDKEGSVELINAFFEETLKDPDFVVTCKNKDGVEQFTETVKGDACYTLYKNGTEVYAYKKGGFFYMATVSVEEDDDGNATEQRYYYCSDETKRGYYQDDENGTMEDIYNNNYCSFMSKYTGVNIVALLPEENAEFACDVNYEKKDGVLSGALNFEFSFGNGTVSVSASSEEGKVKTVRVARSDGADLTWTFVYGNASIELPDTDAWDREADAEAQRIENNEKAIDARNEFFGETVCEDNVIVTVAVNGERSYEETIADDVDCIDFGDYRVYTYMEEDADTEEYDYYYVFDGEDAKYYLVNDDAYDSVVMFYYNAGICIYDAAGESGAAFDCSVEENTLTFTVSVKGETVATLVATKAGVTVNEATYTVAGENGRVVTTYTFVYGSASQTKPDISGWTNGNDSGEETIDGE